MFDETRDLPENGGPSDGGGGDARDDLPKPWDRADVEFALKLGYQKMPGVGIFTPTVDDNTMRSWTPWSEPSTAFDIIAFVATVFGRRSLECRIVQVWARTMAAPAGHADCSIAEFCRTASPKISRATFDRKRIAACERIAQAKNAADAAEQHRQTNSAKIFSSPT